MVMGADRRSVERLTLLTSCTVRADRQCRRRDRTDHRVAGLPTQADKLLALVYESHTTVH
jgi:hypothetical protein